MSRDAARDGREALRAELEQADRRIRLLELERADAERAEGFSPLRPETIWQAFHGSPALRAEMWARLALLSRRELTDAAIELAVYLERELPAPPTWGAIRERWERRLGELARKQEERSAA